MDSCMPFPLKRKKKRAEDKGSLSILFGLRISLMALGVSIFYDVPKINGPFFLVYLEIMTYFLAFFSRGIPAWRLDLCQFQAQKHHSTSIFFGMAPILYGKEVCFMSES